MFSRYLPVLFSILIITGCGEKKQVSNTDMDVARGFIESVQQGDFKQAASLMQQDEENKTALKKLEQQQEKSVPEEDLEKYKKADIIIGDIDPVINDSVTVINYSTSYNKENRSKVKVVKINGRWLIDLKYTFSGNM
ncbi:MAG: DUF4878 domain-containing protein [Ferruginibacter sp.]